MIEAYAIVGALAVFAGALCYLIHQEAKDHEVDEFDGGFVHDNRPRVITKIKANFIEEDYQ